MNYKKYFWNKTILEKLKKEKNYRKLAQQLRHTDIKWLVEDYKIITKEIAKLWKRQLFYANLKRLNSGIYTRNFANKIDKIRMIKGKTAAYAVTEEDFAEISKLIEKTFTSDIHQNKEFLINKMKKLLRIKKKKVRGKNKYLKPSFYVIKNIFLNIKKVPKKNGKILGGKYIEIGEFEKHGRRFQVWERISDNEKETIGPSDTGGDWSDENILATLEIKFTTKDAMKKIINNE